jgi:hypothetical protein
MIKMVTYCRKTLYRLHFCFYFFYFDMYGVYEFCLFLCLVSWVSVMQDNYILHLLNQNDLVQCDEELYYYFIQTVEKANNVSNSTAIWGCLKNVTFIKSCIFWDITLYSIESQLMFGGICRLNLQGRRIS